MNATRLLWPAAAGFALVAVVFRVTPPTAPAASTPTMPRPQPLAAVPALESGTEIAATNMFAANHRPPAHRFLPRGFEPPVSAPRPSPVVLYGVTLAAADPLALIDADPKVPGAEIYRVGQQVRDARLVAITDSTVTLAPLSGGPAFDLHLRRARRPR
jgi:hypothetical protein